MDGIEEIKLLHELLGQECKRTLACNSLKLRFGCDVDETGTSYIWIDPPWTFQSGINTITSSEDYPGDNDTFDTWSTLLNPINDTTLIAFEQSKKGDLLLEFSGGYRIFVPFYPNKDDEDLWYEHWYVGKKS